jgi:hypothetical protein
MSRRVVAVQEVYQNFASTTGANACRNRTPNAYGIVSGLHSRTEEGRQYVAVDCSALGLPYQSNLRVWSFRPA